MQRNILRSFENGVLCMILACLLFAVMGASVKIALREVPIYQAVFFRSIISAFIIGGLILFTRSSFIGNNPLLLSGRGLAGFIALNLNFYTIAKISLGDATILNQTSPLFVALFSALFLGERLSKKGMLLSLVSFVGVALIVKPSFSHYNHAALAGLLGGMVAALAYISISRLHGSDSSLTMAFYFTAISSILSAPFMLHRAVLPSPRAWFCLILAGLTGTFAQLLLTYAYKNEPASRVAPFSYVAVIFSFGFGIALFGEIPDLYSVLGSGIVIASCIVLMRLRQAALHQEPSVEIFE